MFYNMEIIMMMIKTKFSFQFLLGNYILEKPK